MTTAEIIRDQIGHRAFVMMGAKNIVASDDGLTFAVGRNAGGATHVRVTLDRGTDTYTVEFLKAGRAPKYGVRVVSEHGLVHVDSLHDVIETQTGMYLSL